MESYLLSDQEKFKIALDVAKSIGNNAFVIEVQNLINQEEKKILQDQDIYEFPEVSDPIAPPPKELDHIAPKVSDPIAPPQKGPDPIAPKISDPIAPPPKGPDPIAPKVTDPIAPKVTDPIAPKVTDPIAPKVTDPIAPKVTETLKEKQPEKSTEILTENQLQEKNSKPQTPYIYQKKSLNSSAPLLQKNKRLINTAPPSERKDLTTTNVSTLTTQQTAVGIKPTNSNSQAVQKKDIANKFPSYRGQLKENTNKPKLKKQNSIIDRREAKPWKQYKKDNFEIK